MRYSPFRQSYIGRSAESEIFGVNPKAQELIIPPAAGTGWRRELRTSSNNGDEAGLTISNSGGRNR
jgi:hypothetical protein